MIEYCILTAMVIGIAELLKKVKLADAKFIPVWNVIMGLALNLCYRGFNPEGILPGIILGIGATGLYSGGKNVLEWTGLGI